jgi:tryptophanyl-tRNA synthetase
MDVKMSKTTATPSVRDEPADVAKKVRGMATDPARGRRTDPGDPEKCPVWQFHKVYSDEATKDWVVKGCRSAGIGCLDCKQPVIDAMNAELGPIRGGRPATRGSSLVRSIWRVRETRLGKRRCRTCAGHGLASPRVCGPNGERR